MLLVFLQHHMPGIQWASNKWVLTVACNLCLLNTCCLLGSTGHILGLLSSGGHGDIKNFSIASPNTT